MADKLDEEISQVSGAADFIAITLGNVVKGERDPSPDEGAEIISALSFLLGTLAVRATETAHSVGRLATALEKLVEINERDFRAAVDAEADAKADMKQEEKIKRSFIGQK